MVKQAMVAGESVHNVCLARKWNKNWFLGSSAVVQEGLLYYVQKFQAECDIDTKLLKKEPGKKWFESFMKRRPEISRKKAELINKARVAVSKETVRCCCSHVKKLFSTDVAISNNPERIFNIDETAIFVSPKGSLVMGPPGKNIYNIR